MRSATIFNFLIETNMELTCESRTESPEMV